MDPSPRELTGFWLAIAFLTVAAMIGIWDAYLLTGSSSHGKTVSEWVQLWSKQWPILPFVIGLIAGHLFFPLNGR